MIAKTLLLTTVCIFRVRSLDSPDYYWRDYNGIIPEDALSGGTDEKGKNIFIAQIYCQGSGLFAGPINQGKNESKFPCAGSKKTDTFLKILCTEHKNYFYWLSTNAWNFQTEFLDKTLVVNGFKVGSGVHHIGRNQQYGKTQIGPTDSWRTDVVHFYFAHNGQEQLSSEFQVLVYDEKQNKEYHNEKN